MNICGIAFWNSHKRIGIDLYTHISMGLYSILWWKNDCVQFWWGREPFRKFSPNPSSFPVFYTVHHSQPPPPTFYSTILPTFNSFHSTFSASPSVPSQNSEKYDTGVRASWEATKQSKSKTKWTSQTGKSILVIWQEKAKNFRLFYHDHIHLEKWTERERKSD